MLKQKGNENENENLYGERFKNKIHTNDSVYMINATTTTTTTTTTIQCGIHKII